MMNIRQLFFSFFILLVSLQASAQEVECIRQGEDGTVTLLSWGTGDSKNNAIRQAERTAINAILFTGVTKGVQSGSVKPLLTGVNARRDNEDFFDKFFKEKGKYRKYMDVLETRSMKKDKKKNYTEYKCSIAVKVLLPKLKDRMEKDGLL